MPTSEAIVRGLCVAMGTRDADAVRPFLADDVHFEDLGTQTDGPDATLAAFAPVFAMFSDVDFGIVNVATNGSIVFTERIDNVTVDGVTTPVPVLAVFEVRDDKVVRWVDYFNPGLVAQIMGADRA